MRENKGLGWPGYSSHWKCPLLNIITYTPTRNTMPLFGPSSDIPICGDERVYKNNLCLQLEARKSHRWVLSRDTIKYYICFRSEFHTEACVYKKKNSKDYSSAILGQLPSQYKPPMGKAESCMNYLNQFPNQHIEINVRDQLKLIY